MSSLTGLIGDPVAHSKSPRIHTYWAARHGVDTDYQLFASAPEALGEKLAALRAKQPRGFNVTIPHKQAVIQYLDEVDHSAKAIGAVNTVIARDGKWIGTNTDAYGLVENLRQELGDLTPYLEKVLILGAGGATRAAIVGLKEAGAKFITVTNRTMQTAKDMAEEFGIHSIPWDEKEAALAEVTLLINTTSLGMHGKPDLQLNINRLNKNAAVHDIVYVPLETPLLAAARARGHKVVDGLGMLLYQAQLAFSRWHGVLPDVTAELRAAVLEEKTKTLVIGITGGMASGKSTVARMFGDIPHVDADALVHQLMKEDAAVIQEIGAAFPEAVTGGIINRAALATRISHHPETLQQLEMILHPRVRAMEEEAIASARAKGEKAILLDIPLLFETDADALCDVVIVVHAPMETRRERAFSRAGMTEEKWHRLLNRQLADHERIARAHHVVHTSVSMDETRQQVEALKKELGLS